MKRFAIELGAGVLLAGVYVATAKLGLELGAVSRFATLVWPPTGIALATLILFGTRLWPAIAVGAFTVNLWIGASVPEALGIALGNTVEALAASVVLTRLGMRSGLDRLRDVAALVAVAAVLSTALSASIGVASLWLGGTVTSAHVSETARAWWLGDLMGDLVFAPVLLTWVGTRRGFLQFLRRPLRWVEGAAFALPSAWLTLTLFGPAPNASGALLGVYVLFPILTWAALRFGPRGATVTTFLVSMTAIWGTAHGSGPFVRETLSASLLPMQAFMAVVAVTALILAAAIAERNAAVEAREDIAAIVSHDLRVPLSAIQISAQGLLRAAGTDRIRRHVELIGRATGRMNALVADLLDLAMIESGNLSVELGQTGTDSLIEEAVELLRPLAAEKSQEIAAHFDPGLQLHCDRQRILQVLSNLIGNAVKFAPPRGRIAVQAEQEDGLVRFSVHDDGPGLAQDVLDRVFEPFWQARSGGRGVGLGLAIARGIVRAHGGRIWAQSETGQGSTFCFTLPRSTA